MQYCTVACFISALTSGREPDCDCEDVRTVLTGVVCAAHVSLWDSFPGVEFLLSVDSVLRGLKVLLLLDCHLQSYAAGVWDPLYLILWKLPSKGL